MKQEPNEEPYLLNNNWDRIKLATILIVCIAILAIVCIKSEDQIYQGGYLQFTAGLFTVIMCSAGLLALFLFLLSTTSDTILYKDRIEQKKLFAQKETYNLKDLSGKREYLSKGGLSLTLLFGDRKMVILDETNINAFYEYYKGMKIPDAKPNFSWGIFFITLCTMVIIMFIGPALHSILVSLKNKDKTDELITISNAKLSSTPGYEHFKNGPYLTTFEITGYPSHLFYYRQSGKFYRCQGSTFDFTMRKDDYDIKIAHTKPPTFLDKHLDWGRIEVISLKSEVD
jgi:hypothetical protein